MNDKKTSSILQRLPVILAVTAASYGLPVQAQQLVRAGQHNPPANTAPQVAQNQR